MLTGTSHSPAASAPLLLQLVGISRYWSAVNLKDGDSWGWFPSTMVGKLMVLVAPWLPISRKMDKSFHVVPQGDLAAATGTNHRWPKSFAIRPQAGGKVVCFSAKSSVDFGGNLKI